MALRDTGKIDWEASLYWEEANKKRACRPVTPYPFQEACPPRLQAEWSAYGAILLLRFHFLWPFLKPTNSWRTTNPSGVLRERSLGGAGGQMTTGKALAHNRRSALGSGRWLILHTLSSRELVQLASAQKRRKANPLETDSKSSSYLNAERRQWRYLRSRSSIR